MIARDRQKRGILWLLTYFVVGTALMISAHAENSTGLPFEGGGTRENPYLISTIEEFSYFRDLVNGGMDFQDNFFYQTEDIDLLDIPWTPIGIYGRENYFLGIYNGGGHVIENLRIDAVEDPDNSGCNNQGLFGQLGGVVLNLGIESGSVTGTCVGSIASHSAPGTQPYIINCYSRARLSGFRVGGIVDNFSGGTVINCWYDSSQGGLEGPYTGTIASYLGLLIDCFEHDDMDETSFIGEQINSRPMSSIPDVTQETELRRIGILYASEIVEMGMLIPWEYDGESLRFSNQPFAESAEMAFQGMGTEVDPYLIQSFEDLCMLRNLVYIGNEFRDICFCQTKDIVMETEDWIPIGVYGTGHYFWGVYDGAGHTISNLNIRSDTKFGEGNNGLFGQLGGTVLNLGIESGSISGSCVASLASHAAPNSQPYIINCYSRATLSGFRVGGIVDNFGSGTVINCWYDALRGGLQGAHTGVIASYSGILVDCFGQDEANSTDFTGEQIDPRPMSSISQVTREKEARRKGVLYAAVQVDLERLIPWEYNGTSLKFSESPLESFVLDFPGAGTRRNPYLIRNYNDLCNFRDLVCTGNEFRDVYFCQTADIVMETGDWVPIGICDTGHYFWGIYDGAGHTISNLNIKSNSKYNSNGFFGQLAGVVANLGIESGRIEGYSVGSIACRAEAPGSASEFSVAILNCYSKASLHGAYVGGIAASINYGTVANCWSDVDISVDLAEGLQDVDPLERSGGILSAAFMSRIYNCSTTATAVLPPSIEWLAGNPVILSHDDLCTEAFVNRLNFSTAMAQVLFGNTHGVQLREWTLDETGTLQYSTQDLLIKVFLKINEFLPVFTLSIIILAIALYFKVHQINIHNIWKQYSQQIIAAAVILGVVSIFVDCAAVGVAHDTLNLGNSVFLLLCNVTFLFCFTLVVKNISISYDIGSIKKALPILFVMGIAFVLEVLQFNVVPRYDANIFYGSFVRGCDLFRLDFFTYWGAFCSWRQFHGSALVAAPLEFLFPGQIFGLCVANVVITEVTLAIMYRLLRECYEGISPLTAALGSAMLLLCPYQLGMLTHLCYDTHLVYYAVWLLYACKRKNNLLIAFCGFLLSFTKLTGFGFYVVFLIAAALYEVITRHQGNIFKRICNWWKWSRCLLWMCPAVLYALYYVFQEWFVIQINSYDGSSIGFGNSLKAQLDTVLQSLVFGFRWLFVLLILIGVVLLVNRRRELEKYVNQSGLQIIVAAGMASVSLLLALLFIHFPIQIGRYTAPLNVWFVLCLPLAVQLIFLRKRLQQLSAGILVVLLLIQTYWTIDLSIPMFCNGLDTGKKEVYDLIQGEHFLGDAYAYNMEYTFYDDLIQDTLYEYNPSSDTPCYILDTGSYELNLSGVQYPIFWNVRLGRLNYDWKDPDSVQLSVRDINTQSLLAAEGQLDLSDHFYLFVPARIDESEALRCLDEAGYHVVEAYHAENIYGTMTTYEFSEVSV